MEDVVPALLLRLKVPLKGGPGHQHLSTMDKNQSQHQGPEKEGVGEGVAGALSSDELALLGLQGLVSTRPRDLLEYLVDPTINTSSQGQGHGQGQGKMIGRLMAHPMSGSAARALAGVLEVCTGSQTLNHFFSTLVPALCLELMTASDTIEKLTTQASSSSSSSSASTTASSDGMEVEMGAEVEDVDGREGALLLFERDRLESIKAAATSLMTAVSSPGSIGFLVSELSKLMEHESDVRRRRWGCYLAEQLFRCSKAPYGDLVPVLLKNLLSRVAETDRDLLQAVSILIR